MKFELKTEIKSGRIIGVPVAAAARKVPPQIDALCRMHGLDIGDSPSPISVADLDQHFKERGTDLESRFAVKASLRQLDLLGD
jgi:hypothetical protein